MATLILNTDYFKITLNKDGKIIGHIIMSWQDMDNDLFKIPNILYSNDIMIHIRIFKNINKDDLIYFNHLFIEKEYRNKKLSVPLITHAIEISKLLNKNYIFLIRTEAWLLHYYEKLGFINLSYNKMMYKHI